MNEAEKKAGRKSEKNNVREKVRNKEENIENKPSLWERYLTKEIGINLRRACIFLRFYFFIVHTG